MTIFATTKPTTKKSSRLLDCKVDSCKAIFEKPEIQKVIQSDFICEECAEHYKELKQYLDELNVNYVENKLLVRGLDYYNRTVFEIKSNNLGSQNAVCGGGRYDSLVKNLGGEDTPAVGWAMGELRCYFDVDLKNLMFIVSNSPAQALNLRRTPQSEINVEFDLANKVYQTVEKTSKVADYAC
ncbi:MAG: ATP phosphoribosyltransferase regulatory subunit [Candidatus Gastranaerophilaceae bacterium]